MKNILLTLLIIALHVLAAACGRDLRSQYDASNAVNCTANPYDVRCPNPYRGVK